MSRTLLGCWPKLAKCKLKPHRTSCFQQWIEWCDQWQWQFLTARNLCWRVFNLRPRCFSWSRCHCRCRRHRRRPPSQHGSMASTWISELVCLDCLYVGGINWGCFACRSQRCQRRFRTQWARTERWTRTSWWRSSTKPDSSPVSNTSLTQNGATVPIVSCSASVSRIAEFCCPIW